MTRSEANEYAKSLDKHDTMSAQVVRILPESIDPIVSGDNGWDVQITHYPDFRVYED